MSVGLSTEVRFLKGVGEARAQILEAKGIRTVEDLLYYVPRKYQDRRHPKTIGELAEKLQKLSPQGLELQMMSNRGVKVWPGGQVDSVAAEHFICRFMGTGGGPITQDKFVEALSAVAKAGLPIVQAMPLRKYDGVIGYSLAQGQ